MTLRESRRIAFASDSILESLARGEHASTTYFVFSPTSPPWPGFEDILPELKTVLPNADFVIEGYVDPREPLRDEGPFGDHTGYWEVRSANSASFHFLSSFDIRHSAFDILFVPPPSSASRQ